MVKTLLTLYIEAKLVDRINKEALKGKTKRSLLISKILWEHFGLDQETGEEVKKYQMLTCDNCSAQYSNKLNTCPNCASKETITFLKEDKLNRSDEAVKKMKRLHEDLMRHNDPKIEWEEGYDVEFNREEILKEIEECKRRISEE